MQETGLIRKIDSEGRLHIPKYVRERMDWHGKDAIDFFIENDSVILKKFQRRCLICNSPTELTEFRGKIFCRNCMRELRGEDPFKGGDI